MPPNSKFVTISTPVDVDIRHVNVDTYVTRVGKVNPHTGAHVVIQAQLLLSSHTWETCLTPHPDHNFVRKIINYTNNGLPIGYTGPRCPRIHNWKSAFTHKESYDVSRGGKAGPFDFPPFANFVG